MEKEQAVQYEVPIHSESMQNGAEQCYERKFVFIENRVLVRSPREVQYPRKESYRK